MTKKAVNTDVLLANIIKGIEEVKGNDIDILDLRAIDTAVCDYFIICSGSSNTQVNAITGSIQKLVSKELKDKPWHVEGQNNSEWILMDYYDEKEKYNIHNNTLEDIIESDWFTKRLPESWDDEKTAARHCVKYCRAKNEE